MQSRAFGRLVTTLLVIAIAVCCVLLLQRGLPEILKTETRRNEEQARLKLLERLVFRRTADVFVAEVTTESETGLDRCVLEWTERTGRPATTSRIEIAGIQPRFEALVVSFAKKRRDDPLSGRSLVLFRRAYGERTAPERGHSFADPARPVPGPYRLAGIDPEVECALWRDFWTLATDPAAAEKEGVSVVQAKAVSTRVVEGKWYRVSIDASGKADITGPFDERPAED